MVNSHNWQKTDSLCKIAEESHTWSSKVLSVLLMMSLCELFRIIFVSITSLVTCQNFTVGSEYAVKAGMVHVWVAGKTVWSHCYTWTISEHFRDKGHGLHIKVLYKFISLLTFYITIKIILSSPTHSLYA